MYLYIYTRKVHKYINLHTQTHIHILFHLIHGTQKAYCVLLYLITLHSPNIDLPI